MRGHYGLSSRGSFIPSWLGIRIALTEFRDSRRRRGRRRRRRGRRGRRSFIGRRRGEDASPVVYGHDEVDFALGFQGQTASKKPLGLSISKTLKFWKDDDEAAGLRTPKEDTCVRFAIGNARS